jgi:hypothetical protein
MWRMMARFRRLESLLQYDVIFAFGCSFEEMTAAATDFAFKFWSFERSGAGNVQVLVEF